MASDQARYDALREITRNEWLAGGVTPCAGGSTHEVTNVHVIVRCACGAAYMSTDAGIALGMAKHHAANTGTHRRAEVLDGQRIDGAQGGDQG